MRSGSFQVTAPAWLAQYPRAAARPRPNPNHVPMRWWRVVHHHWWNATAAWARCSAGTHPVPPYVDRGEPVTPTEDDTALVDRIAETAQQHGTGIAVAESLTAGQI